MATTTGFAYSFQASRLVASICGYCNLCCRIPHSVICRDKFAPLFPDCRCGTGYGWAQLAAASSSGEKAW